MTKKIILTIFISLLLNASSNAQQVRYDLCKIVKTELKHFIDTIKISDNSKGIHNVYILTIFDNKADKTIFGLKYISSVHNLYNINSYYFSTIDSDFVLIKTYEDPLSTASLIECLNANPISKNDVEKAKSKLYAEDIWLTSHRSPAEYCIIKDGILKVDRSGWGW